VVGVRPFFRTVLHTTTVLYVGFFFENSFHLTRRSYCLPGLIVFLCTPPPCAFEFEMSRTRLLLFIALLSFAFALEMPCRRTPEAAERDRARKRRKRADQSAEDRARVNHQRRERYAQKRALQTSEEREQSNVRRRELRIEMDAEERETVNERRRDQYAQESAQLPAEELAQVNTGRRETYAERRARNLGKTRNNFIREPEASLGDIKLHSVGELCLTCRKCDARLFKGERTAPGNTFSFCCAQGQVQIPRIPRPPSPLDDYLTEQTPAAKHFRGNTRQFNNALSMASTGAKVSDRIASGVQSFTVCGKVHHRMGPSLPEQGARPAFAQL